MLHPATLVDTVVSTLRTNSALVAAMGGNAAAIFAHHFVFGQEVQLAQALYEMPSPSILVSWEGTRGGNFNGETIWKHAVCAYIRTQNAAGSGTPLNLSSEYVFYVMMNASVNSTALNMRQLQLLPNVDLVDTPSIAHFVDQDGIDYHRIEMWFPEIGDGDGGAFTYYINTSIGSDANDGSLFAPWGTTAPADAITLTGSQSIGYFYMGEYLLYRRLGMLLSDTTLPADLITSGADLF